MTTADTIQLRERLLAELRSSTRPLSTEELAQRMPWKTVRTDDSCDILQCWNTAPRAGIRVIECHQTWHVVEYQRTAQGFTGIYRHLRSLEAQGQVRRAIREGKRRVLWTYTGDP
ncbi:hypothetical protein KL864_25475 [Mycolicibacterium goodii]|uniref:hypothetical protein n=1 Tax=Mycolicibacterium goodii TaxID=134601 RepID=UPI001BDCB802|nr:hypothetical protein [Mycolicibacterium goodii]MBU8819249.1 hypothetical protein [Mycolicibacterium goodii]